MDVSQPQQSLDDLCATFVVWPAPVILDMPRFLRLQDIGAARMGARQCSLLLFISHRWDTLAHPDPNGAQLAAVKTLIDLICGAVIALGSTRDCDRVRAFPSLNSQGQLLAAMLAARLVANAPPHWLELEPDVAVTAEDVAARIGVWYDYASMPQLPREPREDDDFAQGLLALPRMVHSSATSFVALRQAGDDYEVRGWCLAEAVLSSGNFHTPVVLRTDLMASALEVLPSSSVAHEATSDLRRQFRVAIGAWQETAPLGCALRAAAVDGFKAAVMIASVAADSVISANDDGPSLTMRSNASRVVAGLLVKLLARLASETGGVLDLRRILLETVASSGLRCSADNDLVYVGLVALIWGSSGSDSLRALLNACLVRHVQGRSLLARISFERANMDMIRSGDIRWTFV